MSNELVPCNNIEQNYQIERVEQLNPAAHTVNNNYYIGCKDGTSRIDTYFQALLQEIENGIKEDVFEALEYYQTKLDGTKGMEKKLIDGGFRHSRIQEATRFKEMYAKIAMQYDCYPSAQRIIHSLFARIKHEFDDSIFPLIEQHQPLSVVMSKIRERIVIPIRDMLEANGAHDTVLGFNEDHIYGMIYYLTGMCHLNWKDYDNV